MVSSHRVRETPPAQTRDSRLKTLSSADVIIQPNALLRHYLSRGPSLGTLFIRKHSSHDIILFEFPKASIRNGSTTNLSTVEVGTVKDSSGEGSIVENSTINAT